MFILGPFSIFLQKHTDDWCIMFAVGEPGPVSWAAWCWPHCSQTTIRIPQCEGFGKDGSRLHSQSYPVCCVFCTTLSVIRHLLLVTPPQIGERSIVTTVSVCVCVSVHELISGNTTRLIFTKFFCECYLWSWLGPPQAALRYIMYFRFYGWRHTCT